MKRATLSLVALALLLGGVGQAKASLITLTGLDNFSANSAGSNAAGLSWNTLGGDTVNDLWVVSGAALSGGPALNGPSDAQASISVALALGINTFAIYGGIFGPPSDPTGFAALNLFFNGNNTNPGISVFSPTNTTSAFAPDSGSTTLPLNDLSLVPGAGTLSFTSGDTTVTLTDYFWDDPSVHNQDLVSPFSFTPDGAPSYIGQVTLDVTLTATPEPASLTLLGLGVAGLAVRGCRRRLRAG